MNAYFVLLIIALVFLPGIIWANIDAKFRPDPAPNFSFFIANSFVFGVIAYLITSIPIVVAVIVVFALPFTKIGIHDLMFFMFGDFDLGIRITFSLLALLILLITLALTPLFAKIWLKVRRSPRLFNYFSVAEPDIGDIDIWRSVIESGISGEYNVVVMDYENRQSYEGEIEFFSGSEKLRELHLRNVIIRDLDSQEAKTFREFLYLSLPKENVRVEFLGIGSETEE